jgi:endoglucanase
VIEEEVTPLVDELRVDPLGSLVAHRPGDGETLVLAAHMDEIGVMVSHIDKNGFLRFARVGGVFPLHCVGSRVHFKNGTTGVIYVERREDASKAPQLKDLYIDVGATSRDDAPVSVGDVAVFRRPLVRQGKRLIGKALDDRIGCYVLIEVLRRLESTPFDLYALFSSQEEVGVRGARTSSYTIDPDIAISIDVTSTGDTPKALPMAVALGDGPAIKIQDTGMITHPKVRRMLVDAAERADLPYQLEVLQRGSTDAAAMQLTRAGVPSGCVSLPCRFVHSPSEMVDADDVENAIRLLVATLEGA